MAAAGRGRGRSSIHRSAVRDRDEEGDQCMQSALGEGDREGNNFCANLEDRDKETEVLGGALLMLDIGADFPLGPKTPLTVPHPGNVVGPNVHLATILPPDAPRLAPHDAGTSGTTSSALTSPLAHA